MKNAAKAQRKNERKRFRRYLRKHTHWRNTDEFFTAILFECGAPPHPVTATMINTRGRLTLSLEMDQWRDKVAIVLNERLHHWINPTPVMERYLGWLLTQQESNRISRL